MTNRKTTLTRAERKARWLDLAEQQFELLHPKDDDLEVYSTESSELWPRQARSRRHARDLIRQVPGHVRHGTGPATQWRVEADLYRRHYTKRPIVKTVPAPSATTNEPLTAEQLADLALEEAGLRATRSA